MYVRSKIEIKDWVLRLLRMVDTSATKTCVRVKSVVTRLPCCGGRRTSVAYEMNGTLYKAHYGPHSEAVIIDDDAHPSRSLTEFVPAEQEAVHDDYGARYQRQKDSPPSNLPGRSEEPVD